MTRLESMRNHIRKNKHHSLFEKISMIASVFENKIDEIMKFYKWMSEKQPIKSMNRKSQALVIKLNDF